MRISDWSSDVCSSDLSSPAPPATCPPAPSPTNTNTRNRVMAVKIEKKITGYAVVGADDKDKAAAATPVAREAAETEQPRSETRRGGQGWGRTWRSGWAPYHQKKKPDSTSTIQN